MADLVPGCRVIFLSAPPSLLKNLPEEDQIAIQSIVGQPVTFAEYDYGQVELEFSIMTGMSIRFGSNESW